MTSGYWRSMLEKHEHLVTFTINLCTSSWTSKFVSISHKVMKVIERPSRFWFLLGTWTWHCKLQKPLKCQQWAVIRVGWVDFFGGWLHQVENRKFYFGDDFISHLIRIPWPLKPTRMTHGLNVISLLPWDWVSGSVLKTPWFLAACREGGNISRWICISRGVRSACFLRQSFCCMVWVRHPPSNTCKTKVYRTPY